VRAGADRLWVMKRKLNNSVRVAATPSVESIDDSLHLTRGDARREAAKLREYREYRERLEEPRRADAYTRGSPPGRHDE
jgi:hypothetical protein